MERRITFSKEHGIRKLGYASKTNPFAGRVICGKCGRAYGRKVWNSTNNFKRIIWRCNNKYPRKGIKGCDNKHIDDRVLYQAFIDSYNLIVENINSFMDKWKEQIDGEDILKRVTAKRLIKIFENVETIKDFDVNLYFKIIEKMTVIDGNMLIVSLLDGTEVEWEN